MAVEVLDVTQFLTKVREHGKKEFDKVEESDAWYDQIVSLLGKAHARGDGIAVYVNHDLGHPELGQIQVMSYGSDASQLETRNIDTLSEDNRKAYVRGTAIFGEDLVPTTLPDIGGRINWRYQLEAVVPAGPVPPKHCTVTADCVYRDGHDQKVFPCRVDPDTAARGIISEVNGQSVLVTTDRLVVVQFKVGGGKTEHFAKNLIQSVVLSGVDARGDRLHGATIEVVDVAVI